MIWEILDWRGLPVPSPRFLLLGLERNKVLVAEKGERECCVQLAVVLGSELEERVVSLS